MSENDSDNGKEDLSKIEAELYDYVYDPLYLAFVSGWETSVNNPGSELFLLNMGEAGEEKLQQELLNAFNDFLRGHESELKEYFEQRTRQFKFEVGLEKALEQYIENKGD